MFTKTNSNLLYIRFIKYFWALHSLVCYLAIQGSPGGFNLLQYFSGDVLHTRDLQVAQYVVSVKSRQKNLRN